MEVCSIPSCEKRAIYLEEFCWDHLNDKQRSEYPYKLLKKIEEVGIVRNENFQSVVIHEMKFPEYTGFQKCDFTGAELIGVILQRADFRGSIFDGATLKNCRFEYSDFRGIDTTMRNADLRETNFNAAWLQNVDMTNSDLRDAILIDADLIGSNLSGSELYASRLLNTRLRKENFCNFDRIPARKIKVGDEQSRERCGKIPTPLRARYVYTLLKNNFRSIGEFGDERWARFKERQMERKRLFRLGFLKDRYSDALALEHWFPEDMDRIFESRIAAILKWLYRWFLTVLGYGETPFKFLYMSIITIIIFSVLFLFLGFEYNAAGQLITIKRELTLKCFESPNLISDLETSLYMSIVTFTTLGYGDTHPLGATRIIASIEALLGFFMYSSFVATFVRRLSEQ